MTLTPFNRYLFSEADRIHVVDECVLLEISPSKRHIKIQATYFTQWVRADRVVFVEDLGKADPESIRNADYEHAPTPCPDIVAGTGVMAVDFDKLVNQTDPPGTHH